MHSHTIPRLLIVGFMFALIVTAAGSHLKVAAKGTTDWTDTMSRENVPVQSCGGFDITSSYTANRAYHVVEDYTGAQVVEHRQVSFSGALANATNGKSYQYDGRFTRTADLDQGKVQISNLQLRFEVGTPGEFSLSLAKVDFDLIDNPPAVVQAIVPNMLHMDLCYLLGGSIAAGDLAPRNIDTNEPLQNLAPSQTSLPCDQPRMDPAYNC